VVIDGGVKVANWSGVVYSGAAIVGSVGKRVERLLARVSGRKAQSIED
jgi:hypothetical protein